MDCRIKWDRRGADVPENDRTGLSPRAWQALEELEREQTAADEVGRSARILAERIVDDLLPYLRERQPRAHSAYCSVVWVRLMGWRRAAGGEWK